MCRTRIVSESTYTPKIVENHTITHVAFVWQQRFHVCFYPAAIWQTTPNKAVQLTVQFEFNLRYSCIIVVGNTSYYLLLVWYSETIAFNTTAKKAGAPVVVERHVDSLLQSLIIMFTVLEKNYASKD